LQTGSARKVLRFWRGEFGDAGESALWSLEMIERNRVATVPDSLVRIVVAVDPSGTKGEVDDGDAVGVVVAGLDQAGVCYVLEDATVKLPPAGWGRVAVSCFERWQADAIVVETNYGGQMCVAVIQAAASAANVRVKIKEVTATRGKAIRAEPISAIYAEGKVCHVGPFPELEDELVSFTTYGYIGGGSPNRADACIWACTEFFGRVTQDPERRDRPPPRVVLSRGASRQLGLPQARPLARTTPGLHGGSRSIFAVDAPMPDDPARTPPGYTQDRWEDMPEERSDFFATRRRQPRVIASSSTYPVGSRPPRRPGSNS
jgi:hypothetical protein